MAEIYTSYRTTAVARNTIMRWDSVTSLPLSHLHSLIVLVQSQDAVGRRIQLPRALTPLAVCSPNSHLIASSERGGIFFDICVVRLV